METEKLSLDLENFFISNKFNLQQNSEYSDNSNIVETEMPNKINSQFHPGTFSGKQEESIQHFLNKFNTYAKINEWDEVTKVEYIPFYLGGTAYDFFIYLTETSKIKDWKQLEMLIKSHYSKSNTSLKTELENRKLKDGEPIHAYTTDICKTSGLIQ